jgi:hypothetical protein
MAPLFSKEIFALPGLKSVLLHRGDKESGGQGENEAERPGDKETKGGKDEETEG